MKIGIGFDIHRLVEGRPLILGGIHLPYEKGLLGHSDGDALLHAMTDALLGALGKGDIGEWFSDQDPQNKNKDSAEMAQKILQEMIQEHYQILSFDTIIFAEAPKMTPFKIQMKTRLAEIFKIEPTCLNLKAKTMETLGPIGQKEAIAAQAVVLLARKT